MSIVVPHLQVYKEEELKKLAVRIPPDTFQHARVYRRCKYR